MIGFFISLFVYSLTGLSLFVLAKEIVRKDHVSLKTRGVHGTMWTSGFFLSVFLFAIIAGARYNTGADHLSYLDVFLHGGYGDEEVVFYTITHFLNSIGVHFFFYFALWASIQIFFIYLACKERRELLPYVALAIMLGPYFLEWMNGIRQMVVACFFVYLVSYLSSHKSIKSFVLSVLGVLFSITIHKSALLFVPFLLLCFPNKFLIPRYLSIGIVISCLIIGMTPYWISLYSGNVSELLELLGYDRYSMTYEDMVAEADFRGTAFGPLRLSALFVDLLIIWFYPKMRESYPTDKILTSFFLFFFVGTCAYNLFVNTNLLFLRPIAYFQIFKLPMVAYLLCYLGRKKSIWFTIVAILSFSYAMTDVLKSVVTGVKEYNVYHFFFLS